MRIDTARKLAQLSGTQRVNEIRKGVEEDKRFYKRFTIAEVIICILILAIKILVF